ncbi:hypothetical protein Mkiyose1665_28360 [Mycobacterium kiyosense]|uniref:STAS domain-containing protein n=1 Tax=Mycobacterium kiyosense TaxID=2871094 RepID=A0A9P3Q6R9_9MYCO|nr:STAS domain-containing protein [Mycobacterium kiyosense]GLB82059.1 hypothetical protein SRL2020028_13150 [Mycobacterium kiyosense]GLB95201.1 hypothetical protein SRL2020226_19770 [Mycobacterium kiyosense]GLC07594.1 hypothetical protein SRL2020411_22400 [Mycobacterium kiyosense]GLD30310.1 hypothetical protein Mkiyose1413_21930 [Mycobacterium kiyosense]GLD35538.1 hypothetical protein Mkiyose1595_17580 [Mycobacterium kiyosense]
MCHYSRNLATVLRVDGEIDASNAELVGAAVRHAGNAKRPLILDLSHLRFIGMEGFQELLSLSTACSMVSGIAMRPLLRVVSDHCLPLVRSVPEALQLLGDAS